MLRHCGPSELFRDRRLSQGIRLQDAGVLVGFRTCPRSRPGSHMRSSDFTEPFRSPVRPCRCHQERITLLKLWSMNQCLPAIYRITIPRFQGIVISQTPDYYMVTPHGKLQPLPPVNIPEDTPQKRKNPSRPYEPSAAQSLVQGRKPTFGKM